MGRHVEDKDRGWKKIGIAAARADGLELRVGLMNWRLKYPKGKGPTEIAKVAGILKVYEATSAAYDDKRGELDAAFERLHTFLLKGSPGVAEWIYQHMGVPLRDHMRARAMDAVSRRSGRMEQAIRATVFEDVKPGRRGPMHAGTVAAGDDPKSPKPSQKIGGAA